MPTRLAEVALKVGVSEATVSRVLNGKPGVSDATRLAVLAALDTLGYERPSQLRGMKGRLVGLVLPELLNPIFPALAEVVGGSLTQLGYIPVLCTRTAGGLTEAEYITMLLDQQVSGVVFCGGLKASQYQHLIDREVAVVLLNAAVDYEGFPQVSTDDAAAVDYAYTHLASLGHRRIGLLVGPGDHVPTRRKIEAFQRRCSRDGVASPPVALTLFSFEGGHSAATELLRHDVTGIICGSDVMALGAIRSIRRAGLEVPGDVSVVGFDDSAFMNYTDPPLTTIRQPIESMARAAVTLLVNQFTGAPTPKELLHDPELVVRCSTGPAPVG
ncbi:DNA-binding LacI/PurR family transcriptional regulator [Catenulispora sp. GAS73]|uniref:LacI family DNA-binding transcriptional regulator n=1 Tax=Catenulispora sp. GAS73 TaxID=3156269 RepID=UPI003514435E